MTHEKVFKRADGSTVIVRVSLRIEWDMDGKWLVIVSTKPRRAKGVREAGTARTKLDGTYRDWLWSDNRAAVLAVVSQDEIESVMRELIEQIKPVF